jgi:hypothetical protein
MRPHPFPRCASLLLLPLLSGCGTTSEQSGTARGGLAATPRGPGECLDLACRLDAISRAGSADEGPGRWQVRSTANFRVFHLGSALAARVAREAEAERARQVSAWYGDAPVERWAPRCDIYLFPTLAALAQASGRDPRVGSASATPSRLYRGRMLSRRLNLAADDDGILDKTLPHEISHVILAELLGEKGVPRWANEGLAMVAERGTIVARSREVVAEYLAGGRTFPVKTLMEMTRYPDGEFLTLYYMQSLSLVRFLLDRGGREKLLQFLRASQTDEVEPILRRLYSIDGHVGLQKLWMDFARREGDRRNGS